MIDMGLLSRARSRDPQSDDNLHILQIQPPLDQPHSRKFLFARFPKLARSALSRDVKLEKRAYEHAVMAGETEPCVPACFLFLSRFKRDGARKLLIFGRVQTCL